MFTDLYSAQMKKFFDPCVNRTLELIDGQVVSLMKNGKAKPKVCRSVRGDGSMLTEQR
jgi:hypothetical protein